MMHYVGLAVVVEGDSVFSAVEHVVVKYDLPLPPMVSAIHRIFLLSGGSFSSCSSVCCQGHSWTESNRLMAA